MPENKPTEEQLLNAAMRAINEYRQASDPASKSTTICSYWDSTGNDYEDREVTKEDAELIRMILE